MLLLTAFPGSLLANYFSLPQYDSMLEIEVTRRQNLNTSVIQVI